MKKYLISFLLIITSINVLSQDVSFSQITNNKLYLNPAFAGSGRQPELTMTYRNHWPSLGSTFVTSVVTYEEYFPSINSGFGLMLMNDRSAGGIYSLNTVNGFYSNQQKITPKLNIKMGMEFSYKQNFVDQDKLYYEDSFNGTTFTSMTMEPFINGEKSTYFDLGAGILFFSDKSFVGLNVSHITEPNQSLIFGDSYLPRKYNLHMSRDFIIKESRNKIHRIYYTPSVMLTRQGEFTELTVNNNIRNGKLLFGGGFRLVEGYDYRDAAILNLGVDTNNLLFFYSYDITISSLGPNTGGSHEVSVVIRIKERQKKEQFSTIPCAF